MFVAFRLIRPLIKIFSLFPCNMISNLWTEAKELQKKNQNKANFDFLAIPEVYLKIFRFVQRWMNSFYCKNITKFDIHQSWPSKSKLANLVVHVLKQSNNYRVSAKFVHWWMKFESTFKSLKAVVPSSLLELQSFASVSFLWSHHSQKWSSSYRYWLLLFALSSGLMPR